MLKTKDRPDLQLVNITSSIAMSPVLTNLIASNSNMNPPRNAPMPTVVVCQSSPNDEVSDHSLDFCHLLGD